MKALVEPYTAIPITQKVKLPSDSCILLDSATHYSRVARVVYHLGGNRSRCVSCAPLASGLTVVVAGVLSIWLTPDLRYHVQSALMM